MCRVDLLWQVEIINDIEEASMAKRHSAKFKFHVVWSC
jgi:hypothetical protein